MLLGKEKAASDTVAQSPNILLFKCYVCTRGRSYVAHMTNCMQDTCHPCLLDHTYTTKSQTQTTEVTSEYFNIAKGFRSALRSQCCFSAINQCSRTRAYIEWHELGYF